MPRLSCVAFLLPITSLSLFLCGESASYLTPVTLRSIRVDVICCIYASLYLLLLLSAYRVRVLSNTNRAPEGVIDVELIE